MDLPTLRGTRVTLRPPDDADLDELVEILDVPGVREWWAPSEDRQDDLRCDGHAFVVEAEGALAGWMGFHEELDPDYRHAGMDILLAPAFHGAGLGPEALRVLARWLIDVRGHHRLTIDPALDNERAIGAYEAIGFRPIGVMRRYERGPDGEWQDGLLMDLLAPELR